MDGRAARMIRLPGWKPPVMPSRSSKPDGGAGDRLALLRQPLELVDLGEEDVVDGAEVLARVLVRDLEDRALGDVDELAGRGVVGVDAGLDVVRRAQEPAEHRVLAHDAGVLAQVPHRGHARGQQVDRGAAAGRVELPRLLEVLDERERVDRLAGAVELEHRREDDPVGLAVEVRRVQPLVDDERRERRVGQQDGAEDRLLGLEVLRRRNRTVGQARSAAVAVRDGGSVGGAHLTVDPRRGGGVRLPVRRSWCGRWGISSPNAAKSARPGSSRRSLKPRAPGGRPGSRRRGRRRAAGRGSPSRAGHRGPARRAPRRRTWPARGARSSA